MLVILLTCQGLKLKKIFKSPFGDSVVKNSRQTHIFSCQIAKSNRVLLKVFKIISRKLIQKSIFIHRQHKNVAKMVTKPEFLVAKGEMLSRIGDCIGRNFEPCLYALLCNEK